MILGINTKYENGDLEKYNSRGSDFLVMANTEWLDIKLYRDDLEFIIPQSCITKQGRIKKYVQDSIDRIQLLLTIQKGHNKIENTIERLKAENELRESIFVEQLYLAQKGVQITIVDSKYREDLVS